MSNLVPVSEQNVAGAPLAVAASAPSMMDVLRQQVDIIATCDPHSPEGLVTLASINFAEQLRITDLVPLTIQAVDIIIRPAEVTDEQTGEVIGKCRTVIVDSDGAVFATMSDVVAKTLGPLVISPFGKGSFEPPLPISFRRVPLKPPQFYLACEVKREDFVKLMHRVK